MADSKAYTDMLAFVALAGPAIQTAVEIVMAPVTIGLA